MRTQQIDLIRAKCRFARYEGRESLPNLRCSYVLSTMLLFLIFNVTSFAQDAESKKLEEIFRYIPSLTDTVMMVRDPYDTDHDDPSRISLPSIWRPRVLGPLQEVPLSKVLESVTQKHVSFALECIWSMEYPSDVGVGSYDGCHIVIVRDPINDSDLISKLHEVAADKEILDGTTWYKIELPGLRDRTCYVTVVRHHIIVAAMSQTAARAMSPLIRQQPMDALHGLPDAADVYRNHACFAWSRYVDGRRTDEAGRGTANDRTIQVYVDQEIDGHIVIEIRGKINQNDSRLRGNLQRIVGNSLKLTTDEKITILDFVVRDDSVVPACLLILEWVGHHIAL